MEESPLQALILAAGKGTRMKSPRAKVLHSCHGIPLLEHALRTAALLGANPTTVVVGHQAEEVETSFSGRATFVRQEPQMGTGHAVSVAREAISRHPGRTLLVLNGDVPLLTERTLSALLAAHKSAGSAATLLTARLSDPGAYGRVVRGDDELVRRIVEARDASAEELAISEINVGVYAFEVPPLLKVLDLLAPHNAQGEYYLTDVVALLTRALERVAAVVTEDPSEGRGVNTLRELAEVSDVLNRRKIAALLASGVVIEDPETNRIGLDVAAEPGACIRPFSILEGRSSLGAGSVVGPFARVADTVVGPQAVILDHCLLRECIVGPSAIVGPFAHIRPESVLGARSKVGNFVELKKTALGEDSKAPHLSYLGDAQIGSRVNVGAGTITCNYDGQAKHPTRIGDGAFVGSDSTLVAPVTVGAGAYVAAGSAITEDVPDGALGIGRARQVVKEGWADARRKARDASGSKAHK